MDPIRTIARAIFAYVYLLVVVRISGKKMLAHQRSVDFVLALVFRGAPFDPARAQRSRAASRPSRSV